MIIIPMAGLSSRFLRQATRSRSTNYSLMEKLCLNGLSVHLKKCIEMKNLFLYVAMYMIPPIHCRKIAEDGYQRL